MRPRFLLFASALALGPVAAFAQTTPVEGLRDNTPEVHALTGARVVTAPGQAVDDATVVIRNGMIVAVGANVAVPADARVWDLRGMTLYPGFIEPYSSVGMRSEPAEENGERGPVYWNPQVRAHVDAAMEFTSDESRTASLRSQGFTVAMSTPQLGMFRGRAAAVSLGDGPAGERVLRSGIAQSVALSRDVSVGAGYPTSAMGAITFIRQTLHDADWYDRARSTYERNPAGLRRPEANRALEALHPALRGDQPLIFETSSDDEFFRVLRIAEEFPLSVWIRGSGYEYRIADEVAGAGLPLLLPVAFPEAPDVSRPESALGVTLETLRHWKVAPENPGRLAAAGASFSFTSNGLAQRDRFIPNVRKAVAHGLAPDAALAALTTGPAALLGLDRTHGTIEAGKVANVVVTDGDLFDDETAIVDVWVDGRRFEVDHRPGVDPRGRWVVASADAGAMSGELLLEGTPSRLTGTFSAAGRDTRLTSATLGAEARRLHLTIPATAVGHDEGAVLLTASLSGNELTGWGEMPEGQRVSWRAERVEPFTAADDAIDGNGANGANGAVAAARAAAAFAELDPSIDYGRTAIPEQPEHVLVRNATIWTQGPQGRIENADLLVTRGRVAAVGQGLDAPAGAQVIDAAGKHVTPGLIDAHIHSGLTGGVNETGSAIVPEVRIGDVLTSQNIWMYRQLAGGLTSAHVMHGSANPIGGQNQHVKMRWGAPPEDLKIEGAPRTVKFALGENVKRRSERYPDTRMGTEQIIRDHFHAARDYERTWAEWESNGNGIPPRRDLRLEALVDILNGDILVQSHSYRQDEILMLMRIAEEFGVTIKAFHHGVEAYKVAPELAAHGAGAVVWSDWSSFKIEAYDATTYNVKVLLDAGVVTSLHSDNSQIASRMNWEAAKMLRTGVGEEEALSLVTNSTAELLGVADRIGSLEEGKDGDFVIWNGHPLSQFTLAEQTWIDGRKYFDLEEDARLRAEVERERSRLIQLALESR